MPIQEIHGIRDLLIVTIAPEMRNAHERGWIAGRYPGLDHDEAMVAWVLDALTVKSLELLADARALQDLAGPNGGLRAVSDD